MTKTLHVEGMMCDHCKNAVKKTLEAVMEVTSAEINLQNGTVNVSLADSDGKEIEQILKSAVENAGYKVLNIE